MALSLGGLGFLMFTTFRSIQVERTKGRSVWREFGLGLSLMILFFATWIPTLPDGAPKAKGESWQLPETPLQV